MKRLAIGLMFCVITSGAVACKRTPFQKASEFVTAPIPPVVSYVTDNAQVIDDSSRKQLEATLAALRARKRVDFSVVTVETTGRQSARDYSLALARSRKTEMGADSVSGLLLLIAVDDRQWHIQITRNLEADLTNEILTDLSKPMTESFRERRYGEGIIKYVNALIDEIEKMTRTSA